MSLNNLYVTAGLALGCVLGFITRDDYLNSSYRKISAMQAEYTDNIKDLDSKINEQTQRKTVLTNSVEQLREQLKAQKNAEDSKSP